MNSKPLVFVGLVVGSLVGSYVPALWGAGVFSVSSIVFGSIGAIVGIYVGFKLSN